MNNIEYSKVYDFTNENVGCLNNIYHFENSKVLSIVGSGDQYFTSILNGASKVDLFDVNETSYLYFLLKFYAIKNLDYNEFYDFFINKNIRNIDTYLKLEDILPKDVLKYYKNLIINSKKTKELKKYFRADGITINSKKNKKYYFNKYNPIIPYILENNYYKLKELLKNKEVPNFYHANFMDLQNEIKGKYDLMLLSNIYNSFRCTIFEYTKILNSLECPEIQAGYDWFGFELDEFGNNGYDVSRVKPSSPSEFNYEENYIYSLKK